VIIMKWVLLIVLCLIDFIFLPLALLCFFWTPLVYLSSVIVPVILVIREFRRSRKAQLNYWKYYYNPNALDEYIKLLNERDQ